MMNEVNMEVLQMMAALCRTTSCICGDETFIRHGDHWSPYYHFLFRAAKLLKPEISVELGVNKGLGSGHLALANPMGIVVGVDIDDHPQLPENVKRFPNFQFVHGDTVERADYVVHNVLGIKGIDFLFIDTIHDVTRPKLEYNTYAPHFSKVCVVFCDDIAIPAMRGFWEWLPGEKYRCDWLHPKRGPADEPGFGFSIVRRQV